MGLQKEVGYITIKDLQDQKEIFELNEEDVKEIIDSLNKVEISILEKAPKKENKKVAKLVEVKTFEDRKQDLIQKGKEKGAIDRKSVV